MTMRTPAIVRTPAPDVVLEAPESVALLLYSAKTVGDAGLVSLVMSALESAAAAASGTVGRHYAVRGTESHLAVLQDETFPRPHAHVLVRDRVERSMFEGWVRYAHARYQAELQVRLYDGGVGITREYPSPHGWEITAAIPQLGKVPRLRCETAPRVLYARELEAMARPVPPAHTEAQQDART